MKGTENYSFREIDENKNNSAQNTTQKTDQSQELNEQQDINFEQTKPSYFLRLIRLR